MKKKQLFILMLFILFFNLLLSEESVPAPIKTKTEKISFRAFDQSKVPKLLKEAFPGIKFYIATITQLYMFGDPDEVLMAFCKGKRYEVVHFNKLWLECSKNKDDVKTMLKSYVLLYYWRDTFHLREAKRKLRMMHDKSGENFLVEDKIPPVYREIKITDFRIDKIKKYKYSRGDEIQDTLGEIIYRIDNKVKKLKFLVRDNQIYDFPSGGMSLPSYYSKDSQRGILFQIISGNYTEGIINDTVRYYIEVSDNGEPTNNSITLRISGLNNGENIDFYIVKIPAYQHTGEDSFAVNVTLTANSSGVCEYIWTPANNNQTGIYRVKILREGKCTIYWYKTYLIPEHIKSGSFNGGYNYKIHYCNQDYLIPNFFL